jgi:inward rectifier potassium channel
MNHKSIDPGLGEKYLSNAGRLINHDGTFNLKRTGAGFHYKDIYQKLLNLSWTKFFLFILLFYFSMNMIFASIYYFIGPDQLHGTHSGLSVNSFFDSFFFSVQTFTTVGYGGIVPTGVATNIVAALEAMTGLLAFALITGLLYGRFSKPSARILYSRNIIVAPYKDKNALMFRIANQRNTNLMELEAKILFSFIDHSVKDHPRRYLDLKLERNSVYFFPLNWTVVHPIDQESPLFDKSQKDLEAMHAEFLILVKGFDDTFSQVVHSRFSYRYNEIVWGAKFVKAYSTDEQGKIIFNLQHTHEYELIRPE